MTMTQNSIRLTFTAAVPFAAVLSLAPTPPVCAAADGPPADSVFIKGRIYTVDAGHSWAEAVAIREGKFVYAGTSDGARAFIGDGTRVVDLAGRMVLPGLHDVHIHPTMGGLKKLYACTFPSTLDHAEVVERVAACAKANPEQAWVVGGSWNSGSVATAPPHKSMLDAVLPDRPVFLTDLSYHMAWVNSKALGLAGLTRDTPDPEGGEFYRDPASGELTGVLAESAVAAVRRVLPAYTMEQHRAALEWAVGELNRNGITGIKVAMGTIDALSGDADYLPVYTALEKADGLSLRVAFSSVVRAEQFDAGHQKAIIESARRIPVSRINPGFIKIFLDGIPMARTSAMLSPYADAPEMTGEGLVAQAALDAALTRFDAAGMTVKMHATGDAAVRAGLDAIAAARRTNGDSGLRHEIGHTNLVDPADLPRFAALGAIAELSPPLSFPNPATNQFYGLWGDERTERSWPMKALIEGGALVVPGSDWPVVDSVNPWSAIEGYVTREHPAGTFPGRFGAGEAIDLAAAIDIYTINAARALRLEERTGSIEPGKYADMIVIDRDLFAIDPHDIDQTRVLMTIFEGDVVHEAAR
jgi:predicted amidohydrolase YtcJ